MIDINKHPIWEGSKLFGKVNPLKKRIHLLRFKAAKQYLKLYPKVVLVGITGSVGKTSTTLAAKAVLSQSFITISTAETSSKTTNLDPIFNLPKTIFRITPKIQRVILEMGIEYKGEMELWLSLAQPSIGIITAVNYAHSEFLGGVEEIAQEKGKLVEHLPKNGFAILNWDDLNVRKIAERTKAKVVFFGKNSKQCHVWVSNIRVENFHTLFELNYGAERVEVKANVLGEHQIYPLLAAATLGITQDIPLTKIKKALESLAPAEHRLQAKPGIHDCVILDDSYNSSPIAVEQALETLNNVPARRRIVVLGEMKELGGYSEKLHRQIANKLYKDKFDLILLTAGETNFIADELLRLGFNKDHLQTELTNDQIVSQLQKVVVKGDVVLVKGSRAVKLEEVVSKLIK